jgi:hypothetical protein
VVAQVLLIPSGHCKSDRQSSGNGEQRTHGFILPAAGFATLTQCRGFWVPIYSLIDAAALGTKCPILRFAAFDLPGNRTSGLPRESTGHARFDSGSGRNYLRGMSQYRKRIGLPYVGLGSTTAVISAFA